MFSEEPLGDFFTLIDDKSQKVMLQENRILFYVVGSGLVHQPNPIQSSGNTSLSDNSDNTSTALNAERVRVDLLGLDEGYDTLRGEFVDLVSLPGGLNVADAVASSRIYDYSRDQNQFEQVTIYSTVDSLARYIESLGFNDDVGVPNGIRDRPTLAHAHWNFKDNSFYSTGDDAIHFGRGGVDDGEDGDIIVHEFGHAIHFDQNACWSGGETGAMGEGFGDYLAASFFAEVGDSAHQSTHAACVGEWDAASYSSSDPPCLRRVDRNKIYPGDLSGSVHADGEIWSRSLWDIRESLGGPAADRIILEHHFLVPCNATMNDAANQLIQADLDLNGGANRSVIVEAFCDRGILTGSICEPPLALRITQSRLPDPPQAGELITLTVTTINESDALLEGIRLSADIPAGTEYVSGSASDSGAVEARQVSWPSFDLGAADSLQRSFSVRLDLGPGSQTVLADDIEAASSAWIVAHQQGTLDWALSSNAPRSGLQHWLASEPARVSDQTLTTAEPFLIAAGMTFAFWHSFDTENRYDGGVIEISTDGGSTWNDLAPQILTNGYTDTISTEYNSPIAGRSAFTGNSDGYIQTQVELDAFAGESGLIRFRMTSDSSIGGSGWSIDDVTISRIVSLESIFRVTGGATATSTSTVQVQPPPPNSEPEIAINAGLTIVQGGIGPIPQTVLQATDADLNDTLTYTVTAGPSEGQLIPASDFTQDQIDAGSVTYQHSGGESLSDAFTFEVDDGRGGSTEAATFAITITPANAPPSLEIESLAVAVANELYVLTVTPTDPDPEDTLTLYVDSGPRWLNAPVDEGNGRWRLSGIPAPGDQGTASVTLRVADDGSPVREISQTFELMVQPQLNAVPTLSEWGQIGIAVILF
ncbi:M36 family metallopeptidase, partial [Myxococcota bacterium]|nr:M36 family metallopeptidase [Myxococcota bacterium]